MIPDGATTRRKSHARHAVGLLGRRLVPCALALTREYEYFPVFLLATSDGGGQ